jgi:hypothetical protein
MSKLETSFDRSQEEEDEVQGNKYGPMKNAGENVSTHYTKKASVLQL